MGEINGGVGRLYGESSTRSLAGEVSKFSPGAKPSRETEEAGSRCQQYLDHFRLSSASRRNSIHDKIPQYSDHGICDTGANLCLDSCSGAPSSRKFPQARCNSSSTTSITSLAVLAA